MQKANDITIRRAAAADDAALYDLLYRSWMTTWAPACPPEAVANFLQDDPVRAYLDACLDQIDIGLIGERLVAAMHISDDHLAALHVDPDLKGQGIGSDMMQDAENRGATQLEVRAFNTDAIRFYENRGWQRSKTYTSSEMGVPMAAHLYQRSLASV
ncbi:MAG: GNAT family N-acetyltransferase [Loktanella sp.]|nr:GNAT family N-acetyltransferase [Loktanella sp.]